MHKIVLPNKYAQYLEICKNVKNVKILKSGSISFELVVKGELYSLMFIALSDFTMPMVILCNPRAEKPEKPHRLYNKNLDLVHLCLSVRDDISIKNKGYREIIDYTLNRIIKLLSLSVQEEEREFRKEFLYFWNRMSTNKEKVVMFIESSKSAKNLNVSIEKENLIIIDPNIKLNAFYGKKYVISNMECLYIPIVNTKGILPPLNDKAWQVEEIQYILNKCISEKNASVVEEYVVNNDKIFIVFEMTIPETLPISFLIEIQYKKSAQDNLYNKIKDIKSIIHWESQRCDNKYLFKRIGIDIANTKKKALVIGAGSLGSYIIKELPQIGYESITIYDNDKLSYENIMRHRLGAIYANMNKASAMKIEMESSYPSFIAVNKIENFSEKDIDNEKLEVFDLIIVATGGTDYMLGLNKKFKKTGIKTPVIFAWIEGKGTGVHSLLVDYTKQGCYQCLYTDSEINKAHYTKHYQEYNNVGTGCGGVFNSYGNLTLLKGSTMILELITAVTNDDIIFELNPLYSIRTKSMVKDKDFNLSKRDLEKKNHFYISERCEICGLQVQE